MATGLEKVSVHSNPKKGQCPRIFKLAFISHTSKVLLVTQLCLTLCEFMDYGPPGSSSMAMFKISQARLQQHMNWELPDVQVGFRKSRGTRDQIANIRWISEKAGDFQKNNCFIGYTKTFDYVDHNKLWKVLKDMGTSDHLTCLLRNLYMG